MNSFIDYYAILGVGPDASDEAIRAAFKKLARQYHPDLYKGEDANERMSALLQAYKTLNNPQTRREYDRRRSEHVLEEPGRRAPFPTSATATSHGQTRSSAARRDRQRAYAFPDIRSGQAAMIDLGEMVYQLSASDAVMLRQQGLLRGVAQRGKDGRYYCHRCHHRWSTSVPKVAQTQPRMCPQCHALDWNEYLLLRCVHCTAVFESEQIRYEVATYAYGGRGKVNELCPPYELFPLCPYCNTAKWCPAEDQRVDALRQQMAQRATMVRLLWCGALIVVMVLLAIVFLNIMHFG